MMGRIVPDSTWFPTTDDLKRTPSGVVTLDPSRHHLTELCDRPLGFVFQAADDRIGWVWVSEANGRLACTADTLHNALEALLDDHLAGYITETDAANDHAEAEWHYRRSA